MAHLLADAPIWSQGWTHIVPVPLHPRRMLRRGYNQADLLARWTARILHKRGVRVNLSPQLLARHRATKPQTELAAGDRFANVEAAFLVPRKRRAQVRQSRIVVIDDVTTTGATLTACRRALESAGAAQTCGLALLRALP
ncbi:MAG: ComF family protein [Nannocystaceae bacterium]